MSTLQRRARAERSMIEQKMDKIQRFPSRLLKLNSLIKKKNEWLEESGTFRVRPILKLKMGKIQ